jgi:hypothetical protein
VDVTTSKHVSLRPPWAAITVVTWLAVTAALAAVAISSRNVGKPTWWLGTASDPTFVALWFLPFLAPIAAIIAALRYARWASFVGMGASLAIAAIAVIDIESTPGVALMEIVVAACAMTTAIASLAGRPRA